MINTETLSTLIRTTPLFITQPRSFVWDKCQTRQCVRFEMEFFPVKSGWMMPLVIIILLFSLLLLITTSVTLSTHPFFHHCVSVFQLIKDGKCENHKMTLASEMGSDKMSKVSVGTWACNWLLKQVSPAAVAQYTMASLRPRQPVF